MYVNNSYSSGPTGWVSDVYQVSLDVAPGVIGNDSFQLSSLTKNDIPNLGTINDSSRWFFMRTYFDTNSVLPVGSTQYSGSISDFSVTAVPEPETYALMLAGLGLVGGIARRRKQKTTTA